ncbi:hypothetical protein [Algoriphagus sp. Y33]|uniref:hypothetical protein n=1 Tax=Algoriphagus sp. Y33 TaxID=2772483 RepID=UPI00177CF6A2|nr:hypothetical protein [Algoriphagus sp. Y33]
MNNYIKTLVLSVLMALSSFVSAQTFPVQATGIFTLDIGNELRLLQNLPSTKVEGIYAKPSKEKLADFEGAYEKSTGKVDGQLTYCNGKKERLVFYFTRDNADASEIYFGKAPNDRKAVGTRKGKTRPTLAFDCANDSAEQGNEPFFGKGSWTGTWKTHQGMIRLIQINDIVTGNVFVVGDFKDTGVIQIIDFEGNEVEGEFTSATQGDGYFKITRMSETKFEGTYRWGLQTEWTEWGGVRTDSKLPVLTSTGAKHLVNRLLSED